MRKPLPDSPSATLRAGFAAIVDPERAWTPLRMTPRGRVAMRRDSEVMGMALVSFGIGYVAS